ncbi:MAG TPA: zinc-binding dehydrogenase [Terriglobia bacterium]|nr:zinc-binding dehydrogenase [Terriglobia bacterium]
MTLFVDAVRRLVIKSRMMIKITRRRVARAKHPGGPEVIDVSVEDLAPLKTGEVLVRIEAAGLNHAETLIRSGNYAVRIPFPHAVGGEGSGTVVETGPEVTIPLGTRVCWAGILGSCATLIIAPASMLVPIPKELSFEDGACLAVAGLTAGGLARVWPLEGRSAAVWGAAGAVGRMLVAILADRGVRVIGIATGKRVDAVRSAGAAHAINRAAEDVRESVRALTDGHGVAAVFDPVGAATYETSLQLLAPRGCLINYGELSGPVPAINLHQLFPASVFVTKYNGMQWVAGPHEFGGLISDALTLAAKRPDVISDIAGRFPLDQVVDAYRALESNPHGKVLVLPTGSQT